ncbi:hypothetical protein BUH_4379 [Burkholderia pseudomallei Pakistan 9]|nr:hypothetical protein BUH_4379 [Burkholderia pseudomallei Pakistan 9]
MRARYDIKSLINEAIWTDSKTWSDNRRSIFSKCGMVGVFDANT